MLRSAPLRPSYLIGARLPLMPARYFANNTGSVTGIDVLKQDHRTVENLFIEMERKNDHATRQKNMKIITEELSKHAAVEEQLLYPLLRRMLNKDSPGKGDQLADRSLSEHQEVKNILHELETMPPDHPKWDMLVMRLKQNVRDHVQVEEAEHFSYLQKKLDQNTLENMATVIENLKAVAPLRPHPAAPNTQPGATVAGLISGFMDRVAKSLGLI